MQLKVKVNNESTILTNTVKRGENWSRPISTDERVKKAPFTIIIVVISVAKV